MHYFKLTKQNILSPLKIKPCGTREAKHVMIVILFNIEKRFILQVRMRS